MGIPWRWFSLPESRLGLNPYDKISNRKPPVVDKTLALHASYFAEKHFLNLMNVMCFNIEGVKDDAKALTKVVTAEEVIKGNVDSAMEKKTIATKSDTAFLRAWYPYKLVLKSEEKATGGLPTIKWIGGAQRVGV